MEREIQRKVVVFTKRNQDKMIEETGIGNKKRKKRKMMDIDYSFVCYILN